MSDQAASAGTIPFAHPQLFQHWTKVDAVAFRARWPNFSPAEIADRSCGKVLIDPVALDKLQLLRDALGKPLIVTSAYRTPEHNKAVGGAADSQHLKGAAFDIQLANHEPAYLEQVARRVGFTGIGRYPANGFIHVDTGPARTWGPAWPASTAAPFQPEPPRIREDIRDSRTLKVSAGTAALGAAPVVAAVAGAIEPAMPLLTWVRDNPAGTLAAVGVILLTVALVFGALRLDDWWKRRR